MKKFSKSDKDAIIVLLLVIIACLALIPVVNSFMGAKDDKQGDSEGPSWFSGKKKDKPQYYAVPEKQYELFCFDPNTADSTQLLRLGLRPWQVRNIYKYRAAGGRYRKPTDFARLYGLTLKQYERLAPYIRIKEEVMAADVYGGSQSDYGGKNGGSASGGTSTGEKVVKDAALAAYPKKLKAGEYVNINTADTNELKRIPGIGSYYARRIVSHRQRLGGIASTRQLLEIEGLPETALPYMKTGLENGHGSTGAGSLAQIRINHLEAKDLARHPYIRYVQAKEIMNFRRLRGNIKTANDLRRLPSFTDAEVDRLLPYIDFN